MNFYRLLKTVRKIRSPRLKLLGLWMLHVTRRRYIGIYLDPVLGCNLRCRMCYFSDAERRKELHGSLSEEDVRSMAKSFFHRAVKLQIGCGAEPTLFKHLTELVREGKKKGVPYIALTTNGQLLTEDSLRDLTEAGMNELTISLHGLRRETYEYFMQGAQYGRFLKLLQTIRAVKQDFPQLIVRVNYTMNADNVEELSLFSEVFKDVPVNVLQLRPIQRIGNSDYQDFSVEKLSSHYESILLPLAEYCRSHGITCLMPTRQQLLSLSEEEKEGREKALNNLTYCYLAPNAHWQEDFDYRRDTFESYSKRTHRARYILRQVFGLGKTADDRQERTRKLNYTVR